MPAYVEMLPRLRAEETARQLDLLAYVAGRHLDEQDARAWKADLLSQMNGGERQRAPKATLDNLAAMGIQVVRE